MSLGGSIVGCQIDGVSYRVKADSDFSETSSEEVEAIATSGDTLYKVTKHVPAVESIDVIVDGVEKQNLKDLSSVKKTPGEIPFSYTEADGTVNASSGRINIDSRTTMENTMTIMFLPKRDWDVFTP